jgi:hypothetical protein
MARRPRVSFATSNLRNLNLPGLPMYGNRTGWTPAQYAAKLDWMARALQHVDADVWGFQELWHAQALQELFALAGLHERYVLMAPPDHRGQRIACAAAVRREMVEGEPEWVNRFPERFVLRSGGDDAQTPTISVNLRGFSRPVLHVLVKPHADTATRRRPGVHVFVAHLKSKQPTQVSRERWYQADTAAYAPHAEGLGAALSTVRRTAEAAALRMLLTDLTRDTDEAVVLMGDLNDGQHSNTQNILTGQPNYLLRAGSTGGSDVDLYATEALQNYRSLRDVYFTYLYQNTHESLDHILVSQEFYDPSKQRLWSFAGLEVFNDHLNFEDHDATGTPDHGIVKASFEFYPA